MDVHDIPPNWTSALSAPFRRISTLVLNRIRRFDDLTSQWDSLAETGYAKTSAEANTRLQRRIRETIAMPGPLGFASSGYFLGVIFMAFLLNRVQNIVVPSRHATSYDRQRSRQTLRQQLTDTRAASSWRYGLVYARLLMAYVLPVDFSSTRSRTIFRIPSIYLLLKALLVWTVVILQVAQFYPSNSSYSWVNSIGNAVKQRSMDDICWFSFLSACAALFIGALTNGLEGLHTTSNAPFNLFGYSFVLYIYASPVTHVNKSSGLPSRPDIHVLITMVLPLFQLTMTHIIEAHRQYAKARLVPTTITSLLSLIHFHLVTFHSFFSSSKKTLVASPSNSDVSSIFATSAYPLPTLVPSLVETFLIFIVLTTLALNALTQILTTGGIRGPLIGLIGHAGTLAPRWDEDFGVVLFRLGTASVEATCVKGFGNEVGGVEAGKLSDNPLRRPTFSRHGRSQFGRKLAIKAAQQERDGGLIELNRSGVVSVYNARTAVGGRVKTTAIKKGFWNEIKHVKASTRQEELWADSLLNVPWYRGLGKFVIQMWRLVKRVWVVMKRHVVGRGGEDVHENAPSEASDRRSASRELSLSADEREDVYERFLRGEDLGDEDDEDDGDFNPDSHVSDIASASDVEEESEQEEDGDEEDGEGMANDTLSLYADLSQDTSASSSSLTNPSVLLAHLASSGALTRQRYTNLLQLGPANSMLDSDAEWIMERRTVKSQHRSLEDDESRRNCVICTAEERQIICWPCRCLALCDDCRENLASRSAASKHICPCCRRNVEGFSRIFIP
ncbi:hypothetical protein BDY19DRAFT_941804 [Irpex rosettiformis]|uniref:Uncharacterized protein n=1 Tax=Irpex rosettiformis TaxID=378272 RepID=A0ACB8U798_9APHY|nr:hypothetical protein BDY19DRAFT_941804 [Irpex rosettiformis]